MLGAGWGVGVGEVARLHLSGGPLPCPASFGLGCLRVCVCVGGGTESGNVCEGHCPPRAAAQSPGPPGDRQVSAWAVCVLPGGGHGEGTPVGLPLCPEMGHSQGVRGSVDSPPGTPAPPFVLTSTPRQIEHLRPWWGEWHTAAESFLSHHLDRVPKKLCIVSLFFQISRTKG